MASSRPPNLIVLALAATVAGLSLISGAAQAQDRLVFESRTARTRAAASQSASGSTTFRGLTINKRPDLGPDTGPPDDDTYVDGPIRYNSIRDFSPTPYIDSGREFPYGLDGVGGYGSDLGYNEGQDAALYDRGAFGQP